MIRHINRTIIVSIAIFSFFTILSCGGGSSSSKSNNGDPGITITPESVVFSENGGSETIRVVLTSKPDGNVVIDFTSSDTSEAEVYPDYATFTPQNWDMFQEITIEGIDDDIADDNTTITINADVNTVLTTDGSGYAALNPRDISVTVQDDDTAGATVMPVTTTFSENGGTGSFWIVLNTKPEGNVAVNVSSGDITEATVNGSTANVLTLFFTPANWNISQTVYLTGIADGLSDGNRGFNIELTINTVFTTDNTGYETLPQFKLPVTVMDSNPWVTVIPVITTFSENGGEGGFNVVLNSQPDGNVVVNIISNDTTEATVSHSTLIFDSTDWYIQQGIALYGVNDSIVDGNKSFFISLTINTVATTDTTGYDLLNPDDVYVTVQDNDTAGITVTPGTIVFPEDGTKNFNVRLNTQPNGNVVINLASNDLTEATINKSSLTFNSTNWSTSQSVTVTGIDDGIMDGNQTFLIAITMNSGSTADSTGYKFLNPDDVSVTVQDVNTGYATITPGTTTFSENGGTGNFEIILNKEPDGNVAIDVSSSDITEATVDGAIGNVLTLTFTTSTWNTPQTIYLSGVDDVMADGNQIFTIELSVNDSLTYDHTGYAIYNPNDVSVTIQDDDTAEITVTPITTIFSENGGSGSFDVVLNTEPNGIVAIDVSSGDTSEATVNGASGNVLTLIFDSNDWSTAQTVNLSGADDIIADGNQLFNIELSINSISTTDDTGYSELNPDDVSVTVQDNDTAEITVTPITTTFSENGGSGSFEVVLNTEPNGVVAIDVSSSDTTEATVDGALDNVLTLGFTSNDWSTAQTVYLSGVDDLIADGNKTFNIELAINSVSTTDYTGYSALNPDDVSVTVLGDDTSEITVTPITTTFSENGGSGSFEVVLNTEPNGVVAIDISSCDITEVTIDGAIDNILTLTFTSGDWSTAQTVYLFGVDDSLDDGNRPVTIVTAINTGSTNDSTGYSSLNPDNVYTIIEDDDYIEKSWAQDAYIKASNNGPNDSFGNAVAVSGDIIVIAAEGEDSNSTTITNTDGQAGGTDDGSRNSSGAVYVIKKDGSDNWIQDAYLKASNNDAFDYFGSSVAINGDIIVVGTPSEDSNFTAIDNTDGSASSDNNNANSGAVYVFKKDGSGNWIQEAYLKASNNDAGDDFGMSVAIDNNIIAVGASGERSSSTTIDNNDGSSSSDNSAYRPCGAVYVFKKDVTGDWIQDAYLKASNNNLDYGETVIEGPQLLYPDIPVHPTFFGSAISISGDFIAVGAQGNDGDSTVIDNIDGSASDYSGDYKIDSGAVYVYKKNEAGEWIQDAYLKTSNNDYIIMSPYPLFPSSDYFGYSVSISGVVLAVGAIGEDNDSATIINNDGDPSIAESNDVSMNSGAVYVFKRDITGDWIQDAYLKASNNGASDWFGQSVSVSGDIIAIGAHYENSNSTAINNIDGSASGDNTNSDSGAVYVFKKDNTGNWIQDAYLKALNNGASDQFGTSVSISGNTIVVGSTGEDSNWADITNTDGQTDGTDDGSHDNSGAVYIFKGE